MRQPKVLVTGGCIICVVYLVYHLGLHQSDGKRPSTRIISPSFSRKTCSSNETYLDFGATLTQEQTERVEACMINYIADGAEGLQKALKDRNIRYNNHTYLTGSSFVIEAGGHLGLDVSELNSRYHPGVYVVLEPVVKFFKALQDKFKDSNNIVLYNFGVDVNNGTFFANKGNDGTSIYKKANSGVQLEIVAVSTLFEKLKVAEKKVDLVTLNCEGCEYAFLDYLLSTDYIHQFRNIQYQSHRVPAVCHPVKRFCWYQELLPKTHQLVFQHKFWWESWTQK